MELQFERKMKIGSIVQNFYVEELKRKLKYDFELIKDRVDVYTSKGTLRDCLRAAKYEIKKIKHAAQVSASRGAYLKNQSSLRNRS